LYKFDAGFFLSAFQSMQKR